jgi:hypothetical protein
MGGSFYSGWLIPRETSLVIWGIERERIRRIRLKRVKVGFPFHRLLAKKDSQKEGIPQDRHLFARQGNNKAKVCHSG